MQSDSVQTQASWQKARDWHAEKLPPSPVLAGISHQVCTLSGWQWPLPPSSVSCPLPNLSCHTGCTCHLCSRLAIPVLDTEVVQPGKASLPTLQWRANLWRRSNSSASSKLQPLSPDCSWQTAESSNQDGTLAKKAFPTLDNLETLVFTNLSSCPRAWWFQVWMDASESCGHSTLLRLRCKEKELLSVQHASRPPSPPPAKTRANSLYQITFPDGARWNAEWRYRDLHPEMKLYLITVVSGLGTGTFCK